MVAAFIPFSRDYPSAAKTDIAFPFACFGGFACDHQVTRKPV
jgi:hypothetical protein